MKKDNSIHRAFLIMYYYFYHEKKPINIALNPCCLLKNYLLNFRDLSHLCTYLKKYE